MDLRGALIEGLGENGLEELDIVTLVSRLHAEESRQLRGQNGKVKETRVVLPLGINSIEVTTLYFPMSRETREVALVTREGYKEMVISLSEGHHWLDVEGGRRLALNPQYDVKNMVALASGRPMRYNSFGLSSINQP